MAAHDNGMAAPRITVQRLHIGCDARSQGVQAYVADEGEKIPLFLAEDRLMPILEKASRVVY